MYLSEKNFFSIHEEGFGLQGSLIAHDYVIFENQVIDLLEQWISGQFRLLNSKKHFGNVCYLALVQDNDSNGGGATIKL